MNANAYEYYRDGHVEQDIEADFRASFPPHAYRLIARHKATRLDLAQAVSHPGVVAVIWVSHASGRIAQSQSVGLQTAAQLVDIQGFDVTDVLKSAHPNLRVVGLVACNGDQIVSRLNQDERFKSTHPALEIIASDSKIEVNLGFSRNVIKVAKAIQKPANRAGGPGLCPVRKGFPVMVSRALPALLKDTVVPGASLRTRNEAILTLGSSEEPRYFGEAPVMAYIPADTCADANCPALRKEDLKLVLGSGGNPIMNPTRISLGALKIVPAWSDASGEWKVFATKTGVPFGVTDNVYRYEGALPGLDKVVEFRPFACAEQKPAPDMGY
ncbi:hypothetical protein WDW86_03860 [Bdellovibrionota bacterium FG-2]